MNKKTHTSDAATHAAWLGRMRLRRLRDRLAERARMYRAEHTPTFDHYAHATEMAVRDVEIYLELAGDD